MSKRTSRSTWVPSWLRHRALIAAEALLLVDAGKTFAVERLTPHFADWGKVLFTMGATVGMLGGVLFIALRATTAGVARTHKAAKAIPLPAATLLLHAAIFIALFVLYACLMGLAPWQRFE